MGAELVNYLMCSFSWIAETTCFPSFGGSKSAKLMLSSTVKTDGSNMKNLFP